MLDERTLNLLDVINHECLGGGYKVFSIEDLVLSIPKGYNADINSVRESLDYLSMREYISVKYEDENEVCLTPLPKGRLVFENRIDSEVEREQTSRKYYLFSALGAFVGGTVVSVVLFVLFLLVRGKI
jgi:hypothetical protein